VTAAKTHPLNKTLKAMQSPMAKQLLHCNASPSQSGNLPVAATHLSTSF
jgi:hypothetical protein